MIVEWIKVADSLFTKPFQEFELLPTKTYFIMSTIDKIIPVSIALILGTIPNLC